MRHGANRHRADVIPLSMVSPGETVELVEIHSGHRLRKRLADLGLNVGMTVRVVQGDPSGPMILAVKGDSRLAIGRGMAHKIGVALRHSATLPARGRRFGKRVHHRARR